MGFQTTRASNIGNVGVDWDQVVDATDLDTVPGIIEQSHGLGAGLLELIAEVLDRPWPCRDGPRPPARSPRNPARAGPMPSAAHRLPGWRAGCRHGPSCRSPARSAAPRQARAQHRRRPARPAARQRMRVSVFASARPPATDGLVSAPCGSVRLCGVGGNQRVRQ